MIVEGMADSGPVAVSSAPEGETQAQEQAQAQGEGQHQQDDGFSRRMEILAKREREFMGREQQWKQQLKEKQELERKYHELEGKWKTIDIDPMRILSEKGWDVNKLAEHISAGNEPIQGSEKHQLYSKLSELEKYTKSLEQKLTERDERHLEEKRSGVKQRLFSDLKGIAESSPEKFELVKETNAYDHVYEVLDGYYSKHGKALPLEQAMEMVENYLESEYAKVLRYKKVKSKLTPEDAFAQQYEQQAPSSYQPKTLSSNFSQSTPPQSQRALTREESIARASQLIRFED